MLNETPKDVVKRRRQRGHIATSAPASEGVTLKVITETSNAVSSNKHDCKNVAWPVWSQNMAFLSSKRNWIKHLKFFFHYFRNALSTSSTTTPLLESPTRETLECIQISNATDGILSLTAMNVVVPCPSIQSFTLIGLDQLLTSSVTILLMVIAKTSHGAQSVLNSG